MTSALSRPPHLLALAAALLGALLSSACGSGGGIPTGDKIGTCAANGGPPITISGQVLYTRLRLSAAGLGPATENRPARFVDVDVRSTGGESCFGRTSTDASGNYSIVVAPPVGTQLVVEVFSRTLEDPTRDLIVHEANPPTFNVHSETNAFRHASSAFLAASSTRNLTVPYDTGPANRPSIGFGMLDTLITCWDGAVGALGAPLDRCNAYTRVGNNFSLSGTSFYSHTARAIAILGGASGSPDNSDTDYFDDAVVAHEFMHFVDKSVSHSMSRGGPHSGGLLEPNFAWSEGLATGFGCLLIREPRYIDTTTTSGMVLFTANAENEVTIDNNTIADEFTVAEVIWDLGDGGAGPTDTDSDGVNVPYADLFGALASFDPQTDAPYVGLFLDRVVQQSAAINAAAMGTFLDGPPEDQQIGYPLVGLSVWPQALAVGGSDPDTVDATGDPSSTCRTYDASRWYQFTLAAGTTITIDLTIFPLGGSGDNLDLFLTRNDDVNFPIASSTNGGATAEQINISLAAGTYIVRVEACGDNNANFTLSIN